MRSSKVVFFDKESTVDTKERLILILSPAFYWFHKEKLNIPLSQAKKIAPSLFDGIIPPGNYSYFVQKVGDEYHFYAYEDQKIGNALQEKGIKPSQVKKVYTAQMIFANLKEPVAVGNKVVVSEDGVVAILPQKMVNIKAKRLDLNSLTLPKKSLPLKFYTHDLLPRNQVFALGALLFIAAILYGIQAYVHKKELATLDVKEAELVKRYHLPPTMLQLKSILASLEKIQNEQLQLREQVESILRLPLQPNEYIQKLFIGKKIRFEIHLSSPQRAQELKNYLSKKLRLQETTLSKNEFFVEAVR